MSAGLLDQWRRHATVVPMEGIGIVYFQNSRAIATEHLGSCSVVLIASAHAAILAHIPPNQATNDPYAGDRQAQTFMNQVAALYQQNVSFFPSAQGLVVCAVYNGSVALPSQRDIMSSSLQRMGINTIVRPFLICHQKPCADVLGPNPPQYSGQRCCQSSWISLPPLIS